MCPSCTDDKRNATQCTPTKFRKNAFSPMSGLVTITLSNSRPLLKINPILSVLWFLECIGNNRSKNLARGWPASQSPAQIRQLLEIG